MKLQVRRWRLATRAVALAVALVAVPLPSLADEGKAAPTPLKASIAKAAATARLEQARPAGSSEGTAQLGSKSFFKTPAGLIVLAVVGAGTGFAVYSASHDRIHSVIRANQ
ncbi:MAG TPA: hypothetical protein VGK32_01425 [Vicinamibacterales bacterium]